MRPATRSVCLRGRGRRPSLLPAGLLPPSASASPFRPSPPPGEPRASLGARQARLLGLGLISGLRTGRLGTRKPPHPPTAGPPGGWVAPVISASALLPPQTARSSSGRMGLYRIRVSTGSSLCAGSNNRVQLWLVGEHGEATIRTSLRPARGQVSRWAWAGGAGAGPGRTGRARDVSPRPASSGPTRCSRARPGAESAFPRAGRLSCRVLYCPKLPFRVLSRVARFRARPGRGWGRRRTGRGEEARR